MDEFLMDECRTSNEQQQLLLTFDCIHPRTPSLPLTQDQQGTRCVYGTQRWVTDFLRVVKLQLGGHFCKLNLMISLCFIMMIISHVIMSSVEAVRRCPDFQCYLIAPKIGRKHKDHETEGE